MIISKCYFHFIYLRWRCFINKLLVDDRKKTFVEGKGLKDHRLRNNVISKMKRRRGLTEASNESVRRLNQVVFLWLRAKPRWEKKRWSNEIRRNSSVAAYVCYSVSSRTVTRINFLPEEAFPPLSFRFLVKTRPTISNLRRSEFQSNIST